MSKHTARPWAGPRRLIPAILLPVVLFCILCFPWPRRIDRTVEAGLFQNRYDAQTDSVTAALIRTVEVTISGTHRVSLLFGPKSFQGALRVDGYDVTSGELRPVIFRRARDDNGYGGLTYQIETHFDPALGSGAQFQFFGWLRMSAGGDSFLLCLPESRAGGYGSWDPSSGAYLAFPAENPDELYPQLFGVGPSQ